MNTHVLLGRLKLEEERGEVKSYIQWILDGKGGHMTEEYLGTPFHPAVKSQIKHGKFWKVGPGLMEFIKEGNVVPYTGQSSIKGITKQIEHTWLNSLSGNSTLQTGPAGYKLLSKWIKEKFGKSCTTSTQTSSGSESRDKKSDALKPWIALPGTSAQ